MPSAEDGRSVSELSLPSHSLATRRRLQLGELTRIDVSIIGTQVEDRMADERFDNLQARHAELDKQIRNEESRRVPDEVALHAMKKGKLAVKDQMAGNVA